MQEIAINIIIFKSSNLEISFDAPEADIFNTSIISLLPKYSTLTRVLNNISIFCLIGALKFNEQISIFISSMSTFSFPMSTFSSCSHITILFFSRNQIIKQELNFMIYLLYPNKNISNPVFLSTLPDLIWKSKLCNFNNKFSNTSILKLLALLII